MITKQENPTLFYKNLYKNLNVLRDIQRLILAGRARGRTSIFFKDENGEVWELRRPNQASKPRLMGDHWTKPMLFVDDGKR